MVALQAATRHQRFVMLMSLPKQEYSTISISGREYLLALARLADVLDPGAPAFHAAMRSWVIERIMERYGVTESETLQGSAIRMINQSGASRHLAYTLLQVSSPASSAPLRQHIEAAPARALAEVFVLDAPVIVRVEELVSAGFGPVFATAELAEAWCTCSAPGFRLAGQRALVPYLGTVEA